MISTIYERMRNFPLREKLLFEIHQAQPENIPTLTQLAHIFMRFKKYRVAVQLMEKAFEVNSSDLLTVCELIRLYSVLRDNVSCEFYFEKGYGILEDNPYNRYRNRFNELNPVPPDEQMILIDLNRIGYCVKFEGERHIKTDEQLYSVAPDAIFNYKLNEGDKVYFGLYSEDGGLFANYVEPYFDNIDDLESLR